MLCSKLAYELALFFPLSQLSANHFGQQLFCFNQRYLYVSVRVAVQRQLASHAFGQACVDGRILRREFTDDIIALVRFLNLSKLFCIGSKEVVQLSNQTLHGRDEFNQSFGDKNRTEVVTLGCTFSNDLGNAGHDVVQRHIISFNLFRDDTHIGLNLQCTFQSDMRSGTSHQLDEVPVFTSRVTVTLDVADYFRVSLASSIETERSFNHIILQVTVDGLGATYYLHAIILGSIVFSQYASISVGVIATDDNQCLDAEFFQDFITFLKLFFLFQLGTARTDDVKTTRIAVFINDVSSQFHIIMVNQAARTQNKAIQFAVFVQLLDTVENTGNHIVTARSLSTGKDNTHVHCGEVNHLIGSFKLNQRHSVRIGEQFLDFFLVSNRLSSCAFCSLNSSFQRFRKFGLIGSPCNLQCTFSHFS